MAPALGTPGRTCVIAASVSFLAFSLLAAGPPAGTSAPATREEVRAGIALGLEYLLQAQNADGSWGSPSNAIYLDLEFLAPETHRSWKVATTGLCCMALLECGGLSAAAERAIGRGLDFVAANAALRRPSDWDADN